MGAGIAESFAPPSASVRFAVGAGAAQKRGGLSRRCEACFLPSESAHRQVGMRRRQPKAGAMLGIWAFVRKAAGSFSIFAVCRCPGRCGRPSRPGAPWGAGGGGAGGAQRPKTGEPEAKPPAPAFQRALRARRPPWAAAVTKAPGGKGAGPNPPG